MRWTHDFSHHSSTSSTASLPRPINATPYTLAVESVISSFGCLPRSASHLRRCQLTPATAPTMDSDRYIQYKSETKHIAKWLVKTSPRGTRSIISVDKGEGSQTVRLATHQMRELARAIAQEAMTAKKLPSGIDITLTVLQSVLRDRRECALFYRQFDNKGGDGLQRKDGHQHFIDVLSSILEKLVDINKALSPRRQTADDLGTVSVAPVNIFDLICADYGDDNATSEEESYASPAPRHATSKRDEDEFDIEDDAGDIRQVLFRFFRSVAETRRSVRGRATKLARHRSLTRQSSQRRRLIY